MPRLWVLNNIAVAGFSMFFMVMSIAKQPIPWWVIACLAAYAFINASSIVWAEIEYALQAKFFTSYARELDRGHWSDRLW